MRSSPSRVGSFRSGSLAASAARDEPDAYLVVFPQHRVDRVFDPRDLIGRQFLVEIDRRSGRAEVEADSSGARLALEDRGQQMLAGVLLHVIEAPGPVNMAAHARVDLELAVHKMANRAVLLVEHVDDLRLSKGPDVERLAAGRRVERRAIEHDLPAVVLRRCFADDGVELDQVGVRVVKALRGHGPPTDLSLPLLRTLGRAARSYRIGRTAHPGGNGS